MRPRQACLGIPPSSNRRERQHKRFNEAEASLPRNLACLASVPTRLMACFNEAEASLPRNRNFIFRNGLRISTLQ